MNAKKILSIALGLFALFALGYAFIGGSTTTTAPETAAANNTSSNELVVYYFHTTFRCNSCLTIERLTKETLNEQFSAELASGTIRWLPVNYEEAPNQKFMEQYKLYTKQVILSAVKGGKEISWKDMDKVWELKKDEVQFKLYMADEIRKFRREFSL